MEGGRVVAVKFVFARLAFGLAEAVKSRVLLAGGYTFERT